MSKKAYRTESQETTIEHSLKVGQLVWLFEFRDTHRYEHLARVDALHPNEGATLSFQIFGEPGRHTLENVGPLRSDSTTSGWSKAR